MDRTGIWQQYKLYKGHHVYRLLFGEAFISRDLMILLVIAGLYALSAALSNTFVNIYLWKQNSTYLTIALFNLFIYISQQGIVILAGRWAKQVDRVIVLRSGVIALSFFYCMVLLLGEQASQWAPALGALLGIGSGLYWLAFNVLTFEVTEPDTRDIFNGFFGLLTSLAGMIGPFFAGGLISRLAGTKGYTVIFALSLLFFVMAVVLSFLLKRRSAKGRFRLGVVLRWKQISTGWRSVLAACAAQGLREGTFLFLIMIWVFEATQSELALGTFGLVTSGLSLIFYYVAGRFITPGQRQTVILFSALLLAGAVWFIAFEMSFTRLLIYGVLMSIAYPLMMVPFLSLSFDVIGQSKDVTKWRIEYIVARELFLNGGRFLSVLLFMASIMIWAPERVFPFFILAIGHVQFLLYFFIRHIK
jgi:YQGE family putative transporter